MTESTLDVSPEFHFQSGASSSIRLQAGTLSFSKDLYLNSRQLPEVPEQFNFSLDQIRYFEEVPGTIKLQPYIVIGVQKNAWEKYSFHFRNPMPEKQSKTLKKHVKSLSEENFYKLCEPMGDSEAQKKSLLTLLSLSVAVVLFGLINIL